MKEVKERGKTPVPSTFTTDEGNESYPKASC
jgi:hypothetical protein